MSDNLLASMIPFMGCLVEPTPEGLRLTGATADHLMAVILTPKTYRPPFRISTTAKTDSTNLRLYWHVGEIIFNWEVSVRRLKIHDPVTGRWHDADGEGFLETNQWHDIVWDLAPDAMRVLVDGRLRFEHKGNLAGINAPVAIGPCFGSTVTVRSFSIDES